MRRVPRSTTSNVLSIVGYGNTSSDFMAQLCADVTQLYTRSSLIAAGAYADDYHTVDDVRRRLNRLAINNITTSAMRERRCRPCATISCAPITNAAMCRRRCCGSWMARSSASASDVFPDLKRTLSRVNITVVCFMPQNVRDRQPYRELLRLSSPESARGQSAGHADGADRPPLAALPLARRPSSSTTSWRAASPA